jgi:hypothetical protein
VQIILDEVNFIKYPASGQQHKVCLPSFLTGLLKVKEQGFFSS